MIEINEKNHASTIISSLSKIYNEGKITGKLDAIDLYLLNIIYKLLQGCCITLTETQKKQLINSYRNIYFHAKNICHTTAIEIYKPTYKTPFFQAETEDCNTFSVPNKIYYWQEEDRNTTINNIIPLVDDQGYFLNKLHNTKENFEIGIDITYNYIGRICFGIINAQSTDTYKIYDILNNDVTHTFNRVFIDTIDTIIFVSENIYSHNIMNLKIKKTNEIFDNGIFNNIFNNIFN
jgi:hypothetical protein